MVDTSVPNSVSLITGAASGIGRHLAIHASNLGHDVVLIDLDANGLDETKKLCSKAETFCIDVGNYKQMVEVKEALIRKILTSIIYLIMLVFLLKEDPGKLVMKCGIKLYLLI